ncbi:MAG TPA: Ig domain-containing protein [Steroidobacteraceae bacterium]|nr:Ig domain-containing protein [Steroidobacteraceae bacterium]
MRLQNALRLRYVIVAISLSACGGGNGGSRSGPPIPPSGLSYNNPSPVFNVSQPIQPLLPTVTGTVTAYAVSAQLPAGLALNTATGVISGTPTQATPKTTYTVSASNSAGSTSTQISIAVNAVMTVAYPSEYYSFTKGMPATMIGFPGAPSASFSVNPPLPPGLTLDPTTGVLSGTPTQSSPPTSYTITASGATVQSAALTMAVSPGPVLDLGQTSLAQLRLSNGVALSEDQAGAWVLWNYASAAQIASGVSTAPVTLGSGADLEGPTAVIQTASAAGAALEVLSAASGQVLTNISVPDLASGWWKLASDGSYVCAGTSTGLTAWTPSGSVLVSLAGDYSKAKVYAGPGEIHIALGPAGPGVVQVITTETGASQVSSAFQGQFLSWFQDGSAFFTSVNSNVWIYSSSVTELEFITLTNTAVSGGLGQWFWTLDELGNFALYDVGGSATPVATYSGVSAAIPASSAMTLALIGAPPLVVLNLSGPTLVATTYTSPISVSDYTASSTVTWLVGNSDNGLILDGASLGGTPRYFDYGRVVSIAGGTDYFAVATASGRILYFDAVTDAIVGTIEFPATSLAMSAAGTVLAALSVNEPTQTSPSTVNVYSLPSAAITYTGSAGFGLSMFLNGSGTALGLWQSSSAQACASEAIAIPGGSSIWCDNSGTIAEVMPSPDSSLVAASTGIGGGSEVTIYQGSNVQTVLAGWLSTWIDTTTLLTSTYTYFDGGAYSYEDSTLDSSSGALIRTLTFPEVGNAQPISSSSVYSSLANAIFSLTNSATLWTSDTSLGSAPRTGAVAGSNVIFPASRYVLAEPYTPAQ